MGSSATAATPPTGAFASWAATPTGYDGAFSTTSGYPTAHVVTTAANSSIAAGKSAFLGASTGFGQAAAGPSEFSILAGGADPGGDAVDLGSLILAGAAPAAGGGLPAAGLPPTGLPPTGLPPTGLPPTGGGGSLSLGGALAVVALGSTLLVVRRRGDSELSAR